MPTAKQETAKPLRIVRMEVENFLRITSAAIDPQGHVIMITGKNGNGKSSWFKAIAAALGGKAALPKDVVHHGADKARVMLDLDQFIVRLTVDAADNEPTLIVESRDKARYTSPAKLLKDLYETLTIDPLAFKSLKPEARRDQLANMTGLKKMLQEMAAFDEDDYDSRTSLNREIKRLTAEIDATPAETVDAVDVEQLIDELDAAGKHNQEREQHLAKARSLRAAIATAETDSARMLRQAEEVMAKAKRDAEQLSSDSGNAMYAANQWSDQLVKHEEATPAEKDTQSIRDRITESKHVNARHAAQVERARRVAALTLHNAASMALTKRMEQREQERDRVIKAAPFPIEGLSITDTDVKYKDDLFDNLSDAEQLRLSAQIGFAMNPRLRIMLVRDGSRLDEDGLALLATLAEENDFQIFVEAVSNSDKIGIVMKNGEIVRNNYSDAATSQALLPLA